ncbi:hypothetical protein [Enterococcus sp.]|uniref:hypothetical protein n=1 Tax=Enterococcus sp. TaxID=35783 RepID=UPI002898331C|nr:hypothetical protein [Enterococcus sp.]
MSELIKRLKEERIQGSSAVLNYSNFDYWVNWDDIVEIVEDHDQPQLNENQQIVLEWLKNIYNSPIIINPIAVVFSLHYELVKDSEIDAVEAYEELGFDEEIQVLQVFSQWAQEREEG